MVSSWPYLGAVWMSVSGEPTADAPHPALGNFLEFIAMMCAVGYIITLKRLSCPVFILSPDRIPGTRGQPVLFPDLISAVHRSAGPVRPRRDNGRGVPRRFHQFRRIRSLQSRAQPRSGQPSLCVYQFDPGFHRVIGLADSG